MRETEIKAAIKNLNEIPGIGKSLAGNLIDIGIFTVEGLKGKDPESLYDQSNLICGVVQDRCVLYAFRCAVYFANTPIHERQKEKLLWWNWTDNKMNKNNPLF